MWDLIVSVPDHCLSFYFFDIPILRKHRISSSVFCSFRIARKSIDSIVSRYIKSTAEKLRTVTIQPRLTEKPDFAYI